METKSEKFQRIRDQRLPKIIHALGLLENLATPSYESTRDELLDILTELYDKVDEISARFAIPIRDRPIPMIQDGSTVSTETADPEQLPVVNTHGRVGVTAPPWASVADMAREVSLEDLSGAMCIYMERMSDVLRKDT